METRTCTKCTGSFTVDDADLAFYKKRGVPPPTLCPHDRQRRRLTHRNLTNLYHRDCTLSKNKIISSYSPDSPCPVYDQEVWWSDQWDPLTYGRGFNFQKPFFEQFHELRLSVPRPNLLNKNSQNSEYTHHSEGNKNVYMGFNVGFSEDCFYITNYCLNLKSCGDCYACDHLELCYECLDSKNCYNCSYTILSLQCSDSKFLFDCRNVQNSFLCWGLNNKQHHILNQPYSKENYELKMRELWDGSHQKREAALRTFLEIIKTKVTHRYAYILASENCTGDYIFNCKDVHDSYFALQSQDCRFGYDIGKMKDCYDVYEPYQGELQYETHACNNGYDLIGCSMCYHNNNLEYSELCYNSSFLFGCIGLRHKQYCIFNKQYSKEEYFVLRDRIREHMKQNKEWGEFFPMEHSLFSYNESVAQEYFPKTKEEILQEGLSWKEDDRQNYKPATAIMPGNIRDVADTVSDETLQCGDCGRNYKILPQELAFYRSIQMPAPRLCFFCRRLKRASLRNPRQLWERRCTKCSIPVKSTFAPDRPETVYCEKCYLEAVY